MFHSLARQQGLFDRIGPRGARIGAGRGAPRHADDRPVVIRWAAADDAAAVRDLAVLDEAAPLRGEVLIALVGGEPWAAVSVQDGRVVADPFRPSAGAAALVRMRAEHLREVLPRRGAAARALRPRRASA